MLISLHASGAVSEVIPKPGKTIEECLLEELGVDGLSEIEYFNPRMLRDRDGDNYGRFAMYGRRFHKPEEEENYVADIVTGMPEKKWCYGPYVIAFEKNGQISGIPKDCLAVAANVVQTVAEMTMKEIPFCRKGEM